ncbi:MAG TPA: cyclic nucleotide-binding domain-containing protein [Actinomycetota bacterium]|jgi:CRP/FNR family cyclic AMP-dependent transcriptional regulator|nr:cyclic nucleotide-binding domain-containing protein [Actinomycetota bacterium]
MSLEEFMAKTTGRVTLSSIVGETVAEVAPARPHGLGRGGPDLLKQVPLFANLSTRHLRKLASRCEVVRYPANRTIVRQDARGDSFFVIADGSATVKRGTRTIGRLEPGDFFGEMALLDGRPRSASVIATTPLVTVRLMRSEFSKAIDDNPEIARGIMAELASRVRRLEAAPVH